MLSSYIKLFDKIKIGQELVFLTRFLNDIQRKIALTLYFINWPNYIVWLPLLLAILGNLCIMIICFPVCDIINFETNLSFLIKLFLYITKKSGQNCKQLKKKAALVMKQKVFFINCKGFSVVRNCLRPKIGPLMF